MSENKASELNIFYLCIIYMYVNTTDLFLFTFCYW